MRRTIIYYIGLVFFGFLGSPANAQYLTHDQVGAAAVFDMSAAYNKEVADCGTPKRPSFLCSGVFLRGTVYSDAYRFWNYGPASVQATAFSWIRKDAKLRQLANDHRHGYIMRAMFDIPADYLRLDVLCAFPLDAASAFRTDNGCGDSDKTVQIERSCQVADITTAEAWLKDYLDNKKSYHRQCGFDVSPSVAAGAVAFMQFVDTHQLEEVRNQHFGTVGYSNNEVRIKSWPQSDGSRVPIWAIFWISQDPVTGAPSEAGKAEAQKDQMALYEDSGHFRPIIRLTLPKTPADDATFFYSPADQAPLDKVMCRRFVDKARWVNRPDSDVKANRWTLEITPTDCGRLSQANQTDKFYAELVANYSNDPQWIAENKGGMRRQLVCVLTNYRTKDVYNLEPFRPDVSQEQAVAAGCNPF